MDMRMIMFIIFSATMVVSFIFKALATLASEFDEYEALGKIAQSFTIRVSIVCICYFMFF